MSEKKSGTRIYLIVFGIIAVLVVLFAASTHFFNKSLVQSNVSVADLPDYGPAPNIQGVSGWINSQPINLTRLRGKIVIVDFWTYSCINCIRSIPHLNAWYNAYGSNGLVIIGVHTPEFQFEHNYSNVYSAVQKFSIKYPVALDNNYSTWDAYNNQYWPADYIINQTGYIRYETFGEGDYNQTELVIRALLENAGYTVPPNLTSVPLGVNFSGIGSPEIYLGYAKARGPIGNAQGFAPNSTVNYILTNITQVNTVYFSGEWYNAPDGMVAVNNSKLFLIYKAKNVNIVAGGNSTIYMGLDGRSLNESYLGTAVHEINGTAIAHISSPGLYNIVNATSYGVHEVEISASPGFKIYTFTFG